MLYRLIEAILCVMWQFAWRINRGFEFKHRKEGRGRPTVFSVERSEVG